MVKAFISLFAQVIAAGPAFADGRTATLLVAADRRVAHDRFRLTAGTAPTVRSASPASVRAAPGAGGFRPRCLALHVHQQLPHVSVWHLSSRLPTGRRRWRWRESECSSATQRAAYGLMRITASCISPGNDAAAGVLMRIELGDWKETKSARHSGNWPRLDGPTQPPRGRGGRQAGLASLASSSSEAGRASWVDPRHAPGHPCKPIHNSLPLTNSCDAGVVEGLAAV